MTVAQAVTSQGGLFDLAASLQDFSFSAATDVGRRDVRGAVMDVTAVLGVDEVVDLRRQVAVGEVVFQQVPILRG